MRPCNDLPDYSTPFYLFGNARPPAARSLAHLVADGFMTPPDGCRLLAVAASDVSVAIVAPHAAAGKSTLLAALLSHLDMDCPRYYLRGSYETFGFARDAHWQPSKAVMIANEISDFLPVYLPRHLTRPAFQLVSEGARLWATAHADGLHDLLARWPNWPGSVPLAVVTIDGYDRRIDIELSRPQHPSRRSDEAAAAIDSVCHAEGEAGIAGWTLSSHPTASGLRPP